MVIAVVVVDHLLLLRQRRLLRLLFGAITYLRLLSYLEVIVVFLFSVVMTSWKTSPVYM
jgi:hypothetical protein